MIKLEKFKIYKFEKLITIKKMLHKVYRFDERNIMTCNITQLQILIIVIVLLRVYVNYYSDFRTRSCWMLFSEHTCRILVQSSFRSLGWFLYTFCVRRPQRKKSKMVISRDLGGQSIIGLPRPIHQFGECSFSHSTAPA